MKYRYPDFYSEFECIADCCRHSCCRDWEICIDDNTVERYRLLPEADEIFKKLVKDSDGYSMRLSEDGSCPFLEKNGLCSLILKYGEDYISDICSEHPRFYNYFDSCCEMGLGLCCEEACRLLLEGDGPVEFLTEEELDEISPYDPWEQTVLNFRNDCLEFLLTQAEECPETAFSELMRKKCGGKALPEINAVCSFVSGLEVLDSSWQELVRKTADLDDRMPPADSSHIRLFQYLLYRHSGNDCNDDDLRSSLMFCLFSLKLIHAVSYFVGREEAVRMFSSEIEYSDINVELIKEYLA